MRDGKANALIIWLPSFRDLYIRGVGHLLLDRRQNRTLYSENGIIFCSRITVLEEYQTKVFTLLLLNMSLERKRRLMNFIELMLAESLQNRNPQLDLEGADRKVLRIACEDLLNFLKVYWKLIGQEIVEIELTEKIRQYYQENPEELREFVNLWTGMWMRKWSERVKLLLAQENPERWKEANARLAKAESTWRRLQNRNEIEDMIINALVKNGEICGTYILAENLLKNELVSYTDGKIFTKEELLALTNKAIKKAKQLSQSKGPLIFVKVDRKFFQFIK